MAHWYIIGTDGTPCRYKQFTKAGAESKRINTARALADGAVMGVTDLLRQFGDPGGLIRWSSNLALDAGVNAGLRFASYPEALAAAQEAYDEARGAAAERGTQIHDAIDAYLAHETLDLEDEVLRTAALEAKSWLEENGITTGWTERCVIYRGTHDGIEYAYGGTVDRLQQTALADWKSVEEKRGKFRDPRPNEASQLAAYRRAGAQMGLCDPGARCANVYFDRATGKIVNVKWWDEEALRDGFALLGCAIRGAQLLNAIA